ncbi:sulfatase domain-containing protein [Cordyceps javanica]|uniref:Sulfatase domain-containing protein n=1 Tax=Cordyceps javanica TaxID=43265 RepID=A0A545V179_9HYPO|nr:sulfatase domain-containing protein [Cordyceps javanica]TQW02588.1 sulfatase domain protein [Cordyceps javanica]
MVFQPLSRRCPRGISIPRPSKILTRKLMLPFAAVSVLSAKLLHIYAHRQALSTEDLIRWGSSFFFQDVIFILFVRMLLESRMPVLSVLGSAITVVVLVLSCGTFACYMTIYTEPDWNNAGIVLDPAWWAVLPTGLASLAFVSAAMTIAAAATQQFWIAVAEMTSDALLWPLRRCFGRSKYQSINQAPPAKFEDDTLNPSDDQGLLGYRDDDAAEQGLHFETQLPAPSKSAIGGYIICGAVALATVVTTLLRPHDSAYTLMSWTLPLQPIVDLSGDGGPAAITSHNSGPNSITDILHGKTALATPIPLSWLPEGEPLRGFEDWYHEGADHYSAEADPLKVSNSQDELIADLRGKLTDVDIRHVVVVKMESIRKDVFPVKQGGKIWRKLVEATSNKTLSDEVRERLATLTPLANSLTCDYDDGFDHPNRTCRGGISANNAFTASTYTLKSVIATLCGIGPVAADFNVEAKSHFYQPCLTHVLQAFNSITHTETTKATKEFQPYPWKSYYFQAATDSFDNQGALFPILGYQSENVITKEYLQSESARFGKSTLSDVNYFSIPEVALEDYIRDAFQVAKEKNERVFLTHLTSTTHHAFGIPAEEHYVHMSQNKDLDDLSNYINAVGYSDRWLTKLLGILEEEGVANETLVVFSGDHGMPVAEDGVATYHNDETASFHVPIVLSHPNLPKVTIGDVVSTMQILPTVLDLLIESDSLSGEAKRAATDLVKNYEGQSLLRPLHPSADNGHGDWQFSVTNPGGATLAARDGRNPNWRLTFPITSGQDWHFVDASSNSTGIFSLSFDTLRSRAESQLGTEVADWLEEAAIVSRWWLEENQKRWRYGRYAPSEDEKH